MTVDPRLLALQENLTTRIEDPHAYARRVSPAFAKELSILISAMLPGDELWEWHWSQQNGRMYNYSNGWCIIRAGTPVDSYCYSYS
jgi:hypothetical protein